MSDQVQKIPLANPGPLGLLGFGMTTVLLNLHNAGLYPLNVVIIAMGLALGGLAQIIAGIFDFKNGNTFGGTAFCAYGTFWWSLILLWYWPTSGPAAASSALVMGYYFLLWGVFTGFMFIGTIKISGSLMFVFATLTILFFLLAIENFSGATVVGKIAGVEGTVCGLSAIYTSVGTVINGEWGRKIFPL